MASKTLRAILLSERRDDIAALMQQFLDLLELWDDIIFGDAVYETNKRREVYLRKPEQLPDESKIQLNKIDKKVVDTSVFLCIEDNFTISDLVNKDMSLLTFKALILITYLLIIYALKIQMAKNCHSHNTRRAAKIISGSPHSILNLE